MAWAGVILLHFNVIPTTVVTWLKKLSLIDMAASSIAVDTMPVVVKLVVDKRLEVLFFLNLYSQVPLAVLCMNMLAPRASDGVGDVSPRYALAARFRF